MSSGIRPKSSSETTDLEVQLNAMALSSGGSSSSSSIAGQVLSDNNNPNATVVRRASIDATAQVRAQEAQQIAAQDQATLVLYRHLLSGVGFPPGGSPFQEQLPVLPENSPAEQAAFARERLAGLDIEDLLILDTLRLNGVGLSCVPSEISLFSRLRVLELKNNQLTSFPRNLPERLVDLNLEHNQIISSDEIIAIPGRVRNISLAYNELTSVPRFRQQINLAGGQFDPTSFDDCEIDLRYNRIEEVTEEQTELSWLKISLEPQLI